MSAEELVFWIDAIGEGPGPDRGVLCQRHGDSMAVPRGWTLDDKRDPHLHLFRPPARPDTASAPARSRRTKTDEVDPTEQLALGGMVDADHGASDAEPAPAPAGMPAAPEEAPAAAPAAAAATEAPADAATPADDDAGTAVASGAWKPTFDDADDLDGLLSAQSPLLSRAFRVNDRPN